VLFFVLLYMGLTVISGIADFSLIPMTFGWVPMGGISAGLAVWSQSF